MSQEKTTLPSFKEVYDRMFCSHGPYPEYRTFSTQMTENLIRQVDSAFLDLNRSLLDAHGREVARKHFRSALVRYGLAHLSEIMASHHGTNALDKITFNHSLILRYAKQSKVSEIALYGDLVKGYLPESASIHFLIATKPGFTFEHHSRLTQVLKNLLRYDVLIVDKNTLKPDQLTSYRHRSTFLLPLQRAKICC